MSRAFVKDADENPTDQLPERPLADHPNYVTPLGLEQLQARLKQLRELHDQLARDEADPLAAERRREADRDIRYVSAQIERAVVVDPEGQPQDEVHFGAIVTICEPDGTGHTFRIVGDDEADLAGGKISWASPLGRGLMGLSVGDTASWARPGGAVEVEVTAIRYPAD